MQFCWIIAFISVKRHIHLHKDKTSHSTMTISFASMFVMS